MLDRFERQPLATGLPRFYGSGESVQADIQGDWREEILVASRHKLFMFIYSNPQPTRFPGRPSPRNNHDYRMNLASIGTGLPKPWLH